MTHDTCGWSFVLGTVDLLEEFVVKSCEVQKMTTVEVCGLTTLSNELFVGFKCGEIKVYDIHSMALNTVFE